MPYKLNTKDQMRYRVQQLEFMNLEIRIPQPVIENDWSRNTSDYDTLLWKPVPVSSLISTELKRSRRQGKK